MDGGDRADAGEDGAVDAGEPLREGGVPDGGGMDAGGRDAFVGDGAAADGGEDAGAAGDAEVPEDAPPPVDDAGGSGPRLLIGQCVTDAGDPCTGSETGHFSAVDASTEVPVVAGTQGAYMVVLAARIWNIAPGDPTDPISTTNPTIQVVLRNQAGDVQASYSRRAGFSADPDAPGAFYLAPLFVAYSGLPPATELLTATATLLEPGPVLHDTTAEFTAVR